MPLPIYGQRSLYRSSTVGRDHEYQRFGMLSLLAGIYLLSGEVPGLVRGRHRSAEFVKFLRLADQHYPAGARIRMVLDDHSAISRRRRVVTWHGPESLRIRIYPEARLLVELVESFFGRLARTLLRGIRVTSKQELRTQIECI